jgi:hypothetical protein
MPQIRGGLPRLLPHHQRLRVDKTKRIDNHFALHGLDGIDDDGDGAWRELLEALLGVDVDRGKPAAEARMRMVPTDDGFGPETKLFVSDLEQETSSARHIPSCLPQHIHHPHLEHRVDGLYTNACPALGHGENIHHTNGEIVDKLAQHQAHHFHRHTGAAVSEHL